MSILTTTVFIYFIFLSSRSEMTSAFRISKQRVRLLSLLSATTPKKITEVRLNGLIDKKGRNNTSYFSSCLDLMEALQMLNNDNYLIEAIEADRLPGESADQITSYLTTSYELAETFLMSDRICDREQFMVDIDAFARTYGGMGLLTGGPSVGKSMLLERLRNNLMNTNSGKESGKPFIVLYLNGRSSTTSLLADLMGEMYSVIPRMDKLKERDVAPGYSTEVFQSGLRVAELMLSTDSKENIKKARETLSKLSEKMKVVIIIDEANAYFRKSSSSSADLLQMFILLTKEKKLVNVLLSTSEFSFPYTLQNNMGFKSVFLDSVMVLGEVLPDDMYTLLTTDFQLRHNLALRLIDLFGGHIYHVIKVLRRLQQSKHQDLVPREAFPEGGIGNVESCLSDCQDDKETKRMVEVLKILAMKGFVPMKGGDKIGRILTRNYVAGFVSPTSSTYGIDKAFAGGMVPSTQTCRLDIVRVLSDEKLI